MDFREAMSKIDDSEVKSHLYKYEKDIKDHTLHYRETKLKIQHDLQKQNMEKEEKSKQQALLLLLLLSLRTKVRVSLMVLLVFSLPQWKTLCKREQSLRRILRE